MNKTAMTRAVPVRMTLVEKRGRCVYELGQEFVWKVFSRPPDMCAALCDSTRIPALRCALGSPSWEEDPTVWYISCPSKKGTVWRLERVSQPR